MCSRQLTSAEREWLDYLRDIGFEELYLGAAPATPAAVAPQAPPAESDVEAGSAVVPEAPPPTEPTTVAAPEAAPVGTLPVAKPAAAAHPGVVEAADLESLASIAAGCTACKLSEGRKTVVFGSGNPEAQLMFIGEGPGAEEDRQGLPFVGPAGNLLTKIIRAIDLERDEVYIANVVKCRPPRNRDPEPEEVAACRGYLERQIEMVGPQVIVALGRVAAQTLLGLDAPLGRMRGTWHTVCGIPARVTYHPAALLRNPSYKRPTWEDMQIVRDRLAEGA